MKKQKGLSTIVATLIIILLVLVSATIIWVVIRNFIQEGTGQIDISSKCFDTELQVIRITNVSNDYTVVLERGTDDQEIGGFKLVFKGENIDSNFIQDVPGNVNALETITVNTTVTGVVNPNSVQTVVYFINEAGNEELCPISSEFNF